MTTAHHCLLLSPVHCQDLLWLGAVLSGDVEDNLGVCV